MGADQGAPVFMGGALPAWLWVPLAGASSVYCGMGEVNHIASSSCEVLAGWGRAQGIPRDSVWTDQVRVLWGG